MVEQTLNMTSVEENNTDPLRSLDEKGSEELQICLMRRR